MDRTQKPVGCELKAQEQPKIPSRFGVWVMGRTARMRVSCFCIRNRED